MFVAGIDAHATYSVIAIVSNTGQLVAGPIRIKNTQQDRLDDLLQQYQPLEVVVETSPAWPWLFDRLQERGIHFVLAHAKRLRVIAESNYKSDDIDAELLARMRLAGLIPEVHPKCVEQREQAVLLRNRARLVRERTRMVNRIHAQIHNVGLHLERGRLLHLSLNDSRFRTPGHLVSYAGLAPRCYRPVDRATPSRECVLNLVGIEVTSDLR